ncbi:MAG: type II secretion system minor pseudopilin GspK [Marinobacter sp.]|uniref:type II secretion system minor pseudopilin GspK n=1 Tax=Marinobacter sp. TaxID=50741 RepID=UPI00299E8BC9|nr:type II secretion system minor pseudopilin GspK [Marinobacter sp.]MDX1634562.1 type II secretion system minor pseudopilin GspK [Marinobacter sp.]
MRPASRRQSQQGVALVMVLLAMALVVMLAAGMTKNQSVRIYKAGHYLAQSQGYSIALGAEAFAKQILFRDYEADKQDNTLVDSPDEAWARYSAVLPLDNGVVEVQIDDLSGRINLNDLVDASGRVDEVTRERLTRLLQVLGVTTVNVDALIDWIDSNDETISAYGAEDGQYLIQDPPYRAANQPFTSVTELRLMDGISEEDYQLLAPHVAALPVSGSGINVNMAPQAVIQALHPELTEAQAESVILQRENERFENVQTFLALPEFAGLGLKAQGLGLRAHFFEVASRITYDDRVVNLVSTVFRSPAGELSTVRRDSGQKNRITKERFGVSEDA